MLIFVSVVGGSIFLPLQNTLAQSNDAPVELTPPNIQEENVSEITNFLIQLAQSGQWPVLIGFLVMLVVYFANRLGLKEKVGSALIPWIALGTSVATNLAGLLLAGKPWTEAILTGILAGLFSVGFWELVGKRFLPT